MICQDPVTQSLTTREEAVLNCLRIAFARPLAEVVSGHPGSIEVQLTARFADLLARLRRVDPFVIRVGPLGVAPTVFELQLVHLVNLVRFQDHVGSNTIVRWLFPEDEIPAATQTVAMLGHLASQLIEEREQESAACLMLRERLATLIDRRARYLR